MATHLYTYVRPIKEKDINTVVSILKNDGVLAVPLDVSWSFICDAASCKALDRIHRLKPQHPKTRPFSLICDSISMASRIANVDNSVYGWLKKSLPGPYTILLERHVSLAKQIHDKRREVGLRVPDSELIQAIVKAFGKPLAASTVPALVVDREPSTLPAFGWQVYELHGHGLDMIVDISEESQGQQTTIVDLTSGAPMLVREGAGCLKVFEL